jgi:hypothetical protein
MYENNRYYGLIKSKLMSNKNDVCKVFINNITKGFESSHCLKFKNYINDIINDTCKELNLIKNDCRFKYINDDVVEIKIKYSKEI